MHRHPRPHRSVFLLWPFALTGLLACSDESPPVRDDGPVGPLLPSAEAGAVAFAQDCAGCHASGDGIDLALFSYPDSTIVRRAVAHVDSATALDIVAHIATFDRADFGRETRLFQPAQGEFAAGDLDFARRLFGADAWPADWTPDDLRAVDPQTVPVSLGFPIWSVESDETDWMPERPLPPSVLDDRGQRVRSLLAGYHAAPTEENLVLAYQALRQAIFQPESGTPICPIREGRTASAICFETLRWVSTLGAVHMLRNAEDRMPAVVHDTWWDVGQAARRSLIGGEAVPQALFNWASWMYLGWTFEPGHNASLYTASGLARFGLARHAAWVALRSLVAREGDLFHPLEDTFAFLINAPEPWIAAGMELALDELETRIRRGDPLPDDTFLERRVFDYFGELERVSARRASPEVATAVGERARALESELRAREAEGP